MGNSVSKGASDVGSAVGNAIIAPLKSIFGHSCEDVCSGIWDVGCFIEHLCVPDLVKLLLVCGLCYVCLVFLYLLFKLGVCQCVVKSLCKISWAACETYWLTLNYICCFCWYKIRNTKRVYRGHRRHRHRHERSSRDDIELGYAGTSTSNDGGHDHDLHYDYIGESVDYRDCGSSILRKRKSRSRRGRPRRVNRLNGVRLKTRQVSCHINDRSKRRERKNYRLKHSQKSSLWMNKRFKHPQRSNLARSKRGRKAKSKTLRLDDS